MISRYKIIAIAAAILGTFTLSMHSASGAEICTNWLNTRPDLSVEPQDSAMAANDPDCYAWRLFVALSWPGDRTTCKADSRKRIGDPGETVWELWRSKYKTYLDGAVEPRPWDEGCRQTVADGKIISPSAQFSAVDAQRARTTANVGPFFSPPVGESSSANDEEVRLNRETYEFIRSSGVYDLNKQEQLAKSGTRTLVF